MQIVIQCIKVNINDGMSSVMNTGIYKLKKIKTKSIYYTLIYGICILISMSQIWMKADYGDLFSVRKQHKVIMS